MASSSAPRQNPFARQKNLSETQVQARPLPSQRAGSYQTAGAGAFGRAPAGDTPPGSSSGVSAQDRLKKKLGQARAGSNPSMGAAGQVQRNNSYGSSTSRGGSDNYEDRFLPSGDGSGFGGGGGDKPFVAATSPWASNESEFGGGSYGYGAPPARQGLPSGPAAGRRGPGLPSGPRGQRF